MPSTSLPCRIFVLLLLAILTVPLAAAAAPDRDNPRRESTFLALGLDSLLSFLTSTWSETGHHIDPNGLRAPGTNQEPQPGAETDEGHMIDPNG